MLGHKLVQKLRNLHQIKTTIRGNFKNYEQYGIFEKKDVFENIDVENFELLNEVAATIKAGSNRQCGRHYQAIADG